MKKDLLMIVVSMLVGVLVVALAKPENPVPVAVGVIGAVFCLLAGIREQIIPHLKRKKAG